jgi:hypothetical protein
MMTSASAEFDPFGYWQPEFVERIYSVDFQRQRRHKVSSVIE